jgi:biopolymer transport protein ExbB/TolQ
MAEEAKAPETSAGASQDGSMRSVLLGSSVVIWILAIFMIVTLNNMKTELVKLNDQVNSLISVASGASVGMYEVADKDGTVVYKFQRIAEPMMEGEMQACPAGEEVQPE